jgi:hypothetical protein
MKAQVIFGALLPFFLYVNAASNDQSVKTLRLSGAELKDLADLVKSHGLADRLAADQSISCSVNYTLALSNIIYEDPSILPID